MTIRNPTSMTMNLTSTLQYDMGGGKINTVSLLSDETTLPFNSYVHGSIEITDEMYEVTIGKGTNAIVISDEIVEIRFSVTSSTTNTINTKLFSYNGNQSEFKVSTISTVPVTVEYIIGTS